MLPGKKKKEEMKTLKEDSEKTEEMNKRDTLFKEDVTNSIMILNTIQFPPMT